MNWPMRYVILILFIIISLHYILTFSHESYNKATSLNHWAQKWKLKYPSPPSHVDEENTKGYKYYEAPDVPDVTVNGTRRAKAAFVILARNGDLRGVIESIKQNEDRFNKKFKYPYVFLNEEPFTEEFKQLTTQTVGSETKYGLIPKEHWYQPSWIDEKKAAANRANAQAANVIYGGSLPYRNMCRYNSGFFFRHPLLAEYRYYWRIEPSIKFFCDINYDPFLFMQDNNKVYGFTLSLYEYQNTIPTLWESVKGFINKNPDLIAKDNLMDWLSEDNGDTYTRCHFWSNFEIGDLDFWRGESYMKFFEHLESEGGFYYERWGDAPVHSIGVGLLARKDQIHFFKDIGYRHEPFQHCPQGSDHAKGKCWCDQKDNFDYEWYSCTKQFEQLTYK